MARAKPTRPSGARRGVPTKPRPSDLGTGAAARAAGAKQSRTMQNELARIRTKQAQNRPLTDDERALLRRVAQSTDASQ